VADAVIPDMSVGVVDWQSDEWRDRVVSWVDDRLAGTGRVRAGPVTQPHLRPWATVLKVPTDRGSVWLKAAGPGTAFEAGLYELLDAVAIGRSTYPGATDPTRGWMLLPDGGPTLGEREAGAGPFASALVRYAELQRRLVPCADELLGRGVADMRPARMLDRFDEAVAGTAEGANAELHARIRAMRGTVAQWCERLAPSALPPSLDHNDLHPWNILDGPAGARFYDRPAPASTIGVTPSWRTRLPPCSSLSASSATSGSALTTRASQRPGTPTWGSSPISRRRRTSSARWRRRAGSRRWPGP
jgi:hypothetical protein